MNQSEIKEKARQLIDGQSVELNGNWFKAKPVDAEFNMDRCCECLYCCFCSGDVYATCEWLNVMADKFYCLTLAHE